MTEDDTPKRANRQKQLIEESMLECFRFWGGCVEMETHGGVPYEYRMQFFKSLRRYRKTFESLKDEDVIEEWWDEVELSEHWVDDNGDPVTGLDSIDQIVGETEQFIEENDSIRGYEQYTVERQYIPPFPVLEDIFNTLNVATKKLGLSPEVPDGPPPEAEYDYADLLPPADGEMEVEADD